MARIERVLALDIGAVGIRAGEIEYSSRGEMTLVHFGYDEYDEELTETSRSAVIASMLRDIVTREGFTAKKALISLSGQFAFTRFVKLPPVSGEEGRVRQIVEFEARQNVPFPMDEVIWDYQLIANSDSEDKELEVMFVVIKNEIVEQITSAIQAVGLEPILVDVAPAACFNAARANRVGEEECAMVLNIGGRSTNLLFADKNRFFCRTIPIAGNTITQQIAKAFGIGFDEAEELKRRHGFVALGGAYEEPESEVAAAVSKIVRNVMARLHGEINRSISVYRTQQKGNRPGRLFLAGGSSVMAFTDHFFQEKLRMDVSYLNPFQILTISPSVDRQKLQEVAHNYSEIIGLALRHKHECPVEVSLIPDAIKKQQAMRQRMPFLVAAMVSVLLMLFLVFLAQQRRLTLYKAEYAAEDGRSQGLRTLVRSINDGRAEVSRMQQQYDRLEKFLEARVAWPELLNELQQIKPEEVWIVQVRPIVGNPADKDSGRSDSAMREPQMRGGPASLFGGGRDTRTTTTASSDANQAVIGLEIQAHAVNLNRAAASILPTMPAPRPQSPAPRSGLPALPGAIEPAARVEPANPPDELPTSTRESTPALVFEGRLQASPFFVAAETKILSLQLNRQVPNLNTFTLTCKLANPIPISPPAPTN